MPDDDRLFYHIEFIVNFADELLEDVFERQQAQNRPEFIDDHGHPAMLPTEFEQQFAHRLALRHDGNFMKHVTHAELSSGPALFGAALPVEQDPDDVLNVNVAEDLIPRA